MAKQTINIGTSELAGDGESLRSALGKVNDNFDEVYNDIATLDGSKIVYGDLSVITAGASGSGSLTYNSTNGTFTFTPAATTSVPTDVSDLTDTTNLLNHFSGDYDDLTNKPTIPTVPTNVSAFTNDAGYITGYTVTESDVTAHQSVLTITQSQISDLSHFSGDYNDLTNKPTIPTVPSVVSAFTNDSGYITGYTVTSADVTTHQAALSITESQISDFGTYLTAETSHADVVVDGDFSSAGIMATDGAGTYNIVTDNSTNWDTAYSWGDHSTASYITDYTVTESDVTTHQAALSVTESQISDLGSYVDSDTSGITGADTVSNIISLTQTEYDAIVTPSVSTVYIIVG